MGAKIIITHLTDLECHGTSVKFYEAPSYCLALHPNDKY